MTTPLSSVSGLISGIDTSSLIDAIIAQERLPATQLETRETRIKNQQDALTSYQVLLSSLQSAVSAMQSGSAFSGTQATTTVQAGSATLATVASTSEATPSSYLLQVSQLAAAAKLSSTSVATAATAIGTAGTFTVQGHAVSITATDTLTTLRDKINALNSGSTPSNVTASILNVSGTDSRLILTSNVSGSAGIALADTTGTVLQSVGLLNGGGTVPPSAVLVAGADAHFTIDGISLVRSSNVVNDAIAGLSITLTQADPTNVARTALTITRDSAAASGSVQNFVTAYNAVMTFVQAQSSVPANSNGANNTPALYGDSMIRGIRSALPNTLLQSVFGAATDLSTVASVGISLGSDGKLTFDNSKFTTQFNNRSNDIQSLFGEQLSSSNTSLTAVSSGSAAGGTYAVNITALATNASFSTSGLTGTYDDGGTPDVLTLTDTQNSTSAQVTLTSGMSTSDIVTALRTAATAAGLAVNISSNGSEVVVTHQNAGSAAGISLALTGGGDGNAAAWGVPVSSHGTDVAGTIGGFVATGSGNVLVANTGSPLAGITVRYAGAALGTAGNVTVSEGAAASLNRVLNSYLTPGSGLFASRGGQLTTQASTLVNRVSDIDARLALRRASLVRQYAAMEAAVASLRQGAASLLGNVSLGASTNSSSSSR